MSRSPLGGPARASMRALWACLRVVVVRTTHRHRHRFCPTHAEHSGHGPRPGSPCRPARGHERRGFEPVRSFALGETNWFRTKQNNEGGGLARAAGLPATALANEAHQRVRCAAPVIVCRLPLSSKLCRKETPGVQGLVWNMTTMFEITSTVFYAPASGDFNKRSKTAFMFHHGKCLACTGQALL